MHCALSLPSEASVCAVQYVVSVFTRLLGSSSVLLLVKWTVEDLGILLPGRKVLSAEWRSLDHKRLDAAMPSTSE